MWRIVDNYIHSNNYAESSFDCANSNTFKMIKVFNSTAQSHMKSHPCCRLAQMYLNTFDAIESYIHRFAFPRKDRWFRYPPTVFLKLQFQQFFLQHQTCIRYSKHSTTSSMYNKRRKLINNVVTHWKKNKVLKGNSGRDILQEKTQAF